MKVVRVTAWGEPPRLIDLPDLPDPSSNEVRLKILAVGVARAVRGRAAKIHPSAFNEPLPYDPSVDGVGLDESTGTKYFIQALAAPLFATHTNINRSKILPLPSTADPVLVAALSNPTSSSYMALKCRAIGGCKSRTVAIVGATSASGWTGAIVSRALGASKIVGLARNAEALSKVPELDHRVLLPSDKKQLEDFKLPDEVGPVDIILDWVGGPAGVALMRAVSIRPQENLQYIQCGGLAGHSDLVVPARLINVKPIRIMASGVGSLSHEELNRELPGVTEILGKMEKAPFEIKKSGLEGFDKAWIESGGEGQRLVLTP